VFAFEPNPATFERLSKRLSKHRNVVCYNLALRDKKESKALYIPENAPEQSSMSILRKHRRIKAVKVDFERLDDFHNITPDIMKIDVEGCGYNVLLGSCETLEVYHPQIILEFHSVEEYKRCTTILEEKVTWLSYWIIGKIMGISMLTTIGEAEKQISIAELCKIHQYTKYGCGRI
jgi:FkbM family methyltransferase